ncbi:hypothetical protein LTR05_005079 [Lithohypha guttulata]|uniref:Cation transporter n=1 Tax=Lithohypha guttulata TaxID=1690604 RepID=A0AAN7SZY2_9EURO|nr:hypothetical protein LTR05_005079 [Lithohypha guttulata]
MCNVGLTTINLGSISGFQQSVLFVDMLLGDLSLVSISVVITRRYFFNKYMTNFLQHSKAGRRVANDVERNSSASGSSAQSDSSGQRRRLLKASGDLHKRSPVVKETKSEHRYDQPHLSAYGGFPAPWHSVYWRKVWRFFESRLSSQEPRDHHYLSFRPKLDQKGRFHSLTRQQQREVGGVEFRALNLLTWLLPAYSIFWMALACIVLAPYVQHTSTSNVIRGAQPGNLNPGWWSIFASVSAYTNCGLNLLNDNMIPLKDNYLVLIFIAVTILAGNTLYPIFLRAIIWLSLKAVPEDSEMHHSLMFLLHHPRRCYLFLFPRKQTLILLLAQVGIHLVAWLMFVILNIGYAPVGQQMSTGLRWFDGLFQAHGLRESGFYIIQMSDIAPALQFAYMILMYTSAMPLIMSIRTTNVYEERSIGQEDENKWQSALKDPEKQEAASSTLSQHLQKQLSYDLWWILVCVWLVSIIERSKLAPSPAAVSTTLQTTISAGPTPAPGFSNGLFAILFETVSAYGTVGLTLGLPYDSYSFCGAWQPLSKLILMTVMLRGRHRVLPMAIDRAVLLPGQDIMEELDKKYRADEDTDGEEERDIKEVREEERGSDHEAEEGESDEGEREETSEATEEAQQKQARRRKQKQTDQSDEVRS